MHFTVILERKRRFGIGLKFSSDTHLQGGHRSSFQGIGGKPWNGWKNRRNTFCQGLARNSQDLCLWKIKGGFRQEKQFSSGSHCKHSGQKIYPEGSSSVRSVRFLFFLLNYERKSWDSQPDVTCLGYLIRNRKPGLLNHRVDFWQEVISNYHH